MIVNSTFTTMKKFYILFVSVMYISNMSAQRNMDFQGHIFDADAPLIRVSDNTGKAAGDSLFVFDGRYLRGSGISNSSTPPFNYSTQDLDNLTLNSIYTTNGFPNKASYLPSYDEITPGDSNFYFATISYFTTPGTANDWISFGPITIPAVGATLSWKHNYPSSTFRDGYKVHVNTVGIGSTNFTAAPIYTLTDNDASTVADTLISPVSVFYSRSKSLNAYAGQSIYLGFQHTANDMDMLLIDDVFILENAYTGIETANEAEAVTMYPNPSSGLFTVNLGNTSQSHIELCNGLGELVYTNDYISSTAVLDLRHLGAGVYSLKVISGNRVTVKEVVITQ